MKKTLSTLAGAAFLLTVTSCSLSDLLGLDFGAYNMADPWSSWENVTPGIYLGTDDDFNPGDLIAKGTDGSIIVCDVKSSSAKVPGDFKGYDADHTTYTFSYGTYKGTDYLKYTKQVLCDKQGSSLLSIANNVTAAKKLWGAECVNLVTFPKKYKKIANGGTFMENYKTICQKYQKLPFQDIKDQLLAEQVYYDVKWIDGLYPAEMNAKGWVIPYTGQMESMTVNRQYDWDRVGERKIFYGGCTWEKVDYVKATVTDATYEEVAAYIAKVKASGKYNVVYEDTADGKSVISFKAGSNDEAENTDGYSGYIAPGYKITYTSALYNTLSIEFSVVYTTFV